MKFGALSGQKARKKKGVGVTSSDGWAFETDHRRGRFSRQEGAGICERESVERSILANRQAKSDRLTRPSRPADTLPVISD
ncbi:hypothetical protein, partial [Mesorhizobium sp. M1A.F.Ca.IN.020.06.1.1]|uniref:hypothetical protein n=1 Tax=Mesorhizobium sp. M1A.F.Ca.IN.020.06.1.1 TaxID=2496765 RepID=UPI0019D44DCB